MRFLLFDNLFFENLDIEIIILSQAS